MQSSSSCVMSCCQRSPKLRREQAVPQPTWILWFFSVLEIHLDVNLPLPSCSLITCSHCKPPLVPALVLKGAKWAPGVAWLLAWASGGALVLVKPLLQGEAAVFLSCRYSRYWIKQVCCCRQTPGTVVARAVFGLEFPGPYQEPPLVTQPVPELTLTFTLRQGLAEHLKGKKMEALRVQMFMPCSFESFYL